MKLRDICRRLLSGAVAAALAVCPSASAAVTGYAEESAAADEYWPIEPVDTEIPSYSEYYDMYSAEGFSGAVVEIAGDSYESAEDGDFADGDFGSEDDIRSGVLLWESAGGEVTYKADIPEDGLYCLEMSYFPLEAGSTQAELSLTIDGKLPFDTASRLTFNRVWVNEKPITTDMRGNQVRPPQVQKGMWQECFAGDSDGLFGEPLFFYLTRGKHELKFTSSRAQIAIERITLRAPKELPDYGSYVKSVGDRPKGSGTLIRLEGENAVYKSDPTLYPTCDNTGALVSPSDPVKVVYNTIGAGNWKKALQSLTWEIPADAEGWYRIGVKARQDQMRGFCSNRRIRIDGRVPCRELDCVKFAYDSDWELVIPDSEAGEDIYVYLEGGTQHTISMECVPGEIGKPLRRLDDAIDDLNRCYRQILMITGPSPDKYTDYYVHEKVPGLVDDLDRLAETLRTVQEDIEEIAGSSGSEAAVLENMAVILEKCVKRPLRIPDYLKQIKDSIASLSAWERDYRDQPLEVDYIELAPAGAQFSQVEESFGQSLSFGAKSFIGSFFEDYTTLSDVTGEEAIEVWVSLGRDQAQIVKEMTENEFMQETGIPVSVNLVIGGVVEAALAGKGPDAALFLGGEFPVNLAARGLLADMTQFDDYGTVKERFQENAMTPYTYMDGVYGIPVTQGFPMLFYRTDVLSELGIDSPPETWDELRDMLPALQRNYMSVGLVLPPANISPATETGHTFAMMMLQNGLGYYNEDMTRSTFDLPEAVQAFEDWTDLYTKYSFEQTYDAFSRFRTGEYPLVIQNYTFANQLAAAAPEISGLWDFCPVPGTVREDGTVSHAANSNGAGAVIFNKVSNKQGAWEFVKWFTDTDTQVRFGTQIEGLLGRMGRFDTANTEALSRLSWSEDEYLRLAAQRAELTEIPIMPSSYAVTRNIMNAFRETLNLGENPRDTLVYYNRDINDEIARKRRDLGLD
ncbi:MAG: extracellular solute-binding protein [Ruminococcus sp.]|nr:extracellular solute-binding protein [Ruminococcus sp.]